MAATVQVLLYVGGLALAGIVGAISTDAWVWARSRFRSWRATRSEQNLEKEIEYWRGEIADAEKALAQPLYGMAKFVELFVPTFVYSGGITLVVLAMLLFLDSIASPKSLAHDLGSILTAWVALGMAFVAITLVGMIKFWIRRFTNHEEWKAETEARILALQAKLDERRERS